MYEYKTLLDKLIPSISYHLFRSDSVLQDGHGRESPARSANRSETSRRRRCGDVADTSSNRIESSSSAIDSRFGRTELNGL